MNRLHSWAALTLASGALVASVAASRPTEPRQGATGPASFLRVGGCYAMAFTIDSAPSYKVVEILDGGWIRAEVDSGSSAAARRLSFWANTAQIVTVRELRCSD